MIREHVRTTVPDFKGPSWLEDDLGPGDLLLIAEDDGYAEDPTEEIPVVANSRPALWSDRVPQG